MLSKLKKFYKGLQESVGQGRGQGPSTPLPTANSQVPEVNSSAMVQAFLAREQRGDTTNSTPNTFGRGQLGHAVRTKQRQGPPIKSSTATTTYKIFGRGQRMHALSSTAESAPLNPSPNPEAKRDAKLLAGMRGSSGSRFG